MAVFRTPDERFEDLPGYSFAPNYAEVDGMRMHYLDEGSGDPIVLFHGEPTWSYLYRKIVPPLAEHHRVVAPDFIGFGRSDKITEREAYTYDKHCKWVSELLAGLDLRNVTVVVQDWGGPIGLRWAVENGDCVARLVIMNTGIFHGRTKISDAFMTWRSFVEQNPDLPVGTIVQGATSEAVPDDVIAAYEAPFPNAESKAGAAQFPLIVPLEESDPGAREMDIVHKALGLWQQPTLVLFSDSDPIFKPSAGQRLVEMIPGADELHIVEGASHFLQEDRGEAIAVQILEFIRGT